MKNNLPERWCGSKLEEILVFVLGGDWGKDPSIQNKDFSNALCIRGSELKNWQRDKGRSAALRSIKITSLEKRRLKENDILLEISGGGPDQPVGRTVVIDKEVLNIEPGLPKVCTNFFRLLRPSSNINSTFLNYYLQSFYKSGEVVKYQGGSNNLRNLKFKDYKKISIPIPPILEQNKIAERLDIIMDELKTTHTKLDVFPKIIKDFRQSVLHKAFSGELTKMWRKGSNLHDKKENKQLIDLLSERPRNGFSPKGVDFVTNVKSLSLGATTSGKFDPSKKKYLDIDRPSKDSHLWLKNGDLLVQRSNSLDYVGVSAIYDGIDDDFIYPDLMMKLRLKDKNLTNYIYYQLSSIRVREYFRKNASGTAGNMPKINQRIVSETPIVLYSEEEQQEIVRRIEELFAIADQLEVKCKLAKEKLVVLPYAILDKAFRGELLSEKELENIRKSPDWESSEKLLDRINEEKNEGASIPKKGVRK
ncbi:restriction endonuclease subunit S [Ancylomarina longa]|uniref:Type I restriction endonuclease subunit S n=1 Tax=Ancylomarina longa TaxID=2487017 RepID=A0A434AWZ0_9BACT|nr:restriction endonuclease subunit S [Ancylomarina longa]RUT78946.1 type I restriction endonuclease subunit S [Ancylomarina longa]